MFKKSWRLIFERFQASQRAGLCLAGSSRTGGTPGQGRDVFEINCINTMEHYNTSVQQGQDKGVTTSGSNISFWLDSVEAIRFSPLTLNVRTEVVIIGGGIAGLSVAYCLVKAGKKVVVVEDGFIGSGESGRTTAHLVNALDDRFAEIERVLGKEKCRFA